MHRLIKADTLDRLGLREVKNDLSKAEFVIQMLLLLDSVNERELTSCCRHYDRIASGIMMQQGDSDMEHGGPRDDTICF